VELEFTALLDRSGRTLPEIPIIFNKQSTSVSGPYDDIHLPPDSEQLAYEGELAVVIGGRCRRVPREAARGVIAGYAVANDVSLRDWQLRVPTMTMGKSWGYPLSLGPVDCYPRRACRPTFSGPSNLGKR